MKREHQPALQVGKVQLATSVWRTHAVIVPAGTDIETVMVPSYWKHHVNAVSGNDIIEVVAEDGTWEASFRVRMTGPGEVHLALRSKLEYDTEEMLEPNDTYTVKWISPPLKWGVRRQDTNEIVKSGFAQKEQAIRYMLTLTPRLVA